MSSKVTCSCGWSWDKKDSSKKDMYVCHECGKDNTMKDGGWLEKFQNGGEKLTTQPLPFNTITALKEDAKKFRAAGVTKQDRINAIRENNANWNINDYKQFGLKEPGIESPPVDPIDLIGGAIAGKALIGGVGLLKSLNVPAGAIDLMKNRALKIAAAKGAIGSTLGGLFGTGIEIAGGTENDYNANTKFNDGGPVQPNYNDADAFYSEDYVGAGYDIIGRNYSPAWGGQFEHGGTLPGSVGFTYARTKGIPSNGPYAKKTKASAQNGKEMQFYQNGLDWKPKSISRDGSVIEDDRGQWDHPGEITKINSNEITMQGVDYPVLGVSDTGDTQMMQPGKDYTYDGKSVTEYPMMKDGGWLSKYDLPKAQTGKDLDFKSLMNPGIKQDATKVVRQEIMSEAEAKKLKARKDAEELARRKQAIATSAAAKDPRNQGKFLNPLENLADETGAIGDKLRLFPNDPDSFIDDYLNPGVMVGNIASGLGRVPLNIDEGNYGEAAMAIGIPLAFGAMEQLAAPYTNKLLRPVTQYLPEKGQVINELSNLKKAAFPNKPTFINPNEQELLSTVRNVGIMTKTGTNDAAVLEKILNKSSNLSDDEFQNLVGSTRSELEGKIQTLKEAGATKKPNTIASELSSDNDVDPSWIRMQERLRARGHNFPSTSSPEEVINLARPNRSQDINRAIASGILNEPQLATPQEFILDIGSGFNWKPSLENKSLIKGLTDKINTKRYLPVSNEKGQSLLPSLYRTDTNNPVAEIIKAYRTLESSPKGSTFKSASSLSTDSYPATLKMTQKALSNNLAELNYTGMGTLNSSGFSQSAGLSKNLNLKEINTMIDMLNKKLPKPIPYAYKEGSDIIAPQVSLTRKKNGGWLSKYN